MHDLKPPPLPESAQVFADVIGREATLRLAAKSQYRACYVPKVENLDERHWIARAIGYARARHLARAFGGCHMVLASCRSIVKADRDARMVKSYLAGESPALIAQAHSVSVYTVLRAIDAVNARCLKKS